MRTQKTNVILATDISGFGEDFDTVRSDITTGDLQSRFGQMMDQDQSSAENLEAAELGQDGYYAITPEDEVLLWGSDSDQLSDDGPGLTAQDVWAEPEAATEEEVLLDLEQRLRSKQLEADDLIVEEEPFLINQEPSGRCPMKPLLPVS
jgi:hypothetical protein